ncbi:uncharacterized protein LOC143283451 isoform X2 [Babylonia areolata]
MQRHSPHSHNPVGVARLCDWSTESPEKAGESHVSMSRLYRDIAGGVGTGSLPPPLPPARHSFEKDRPRVVGSGGSSPVTVTVAAGPWPGGGGSSRVSPGRMFLRDKGMLTKGEREIIQGIYRNRGDLYGKQPATASRSDFFVRSHHDAWLVGKPGLPGNKPSTEVPRDSARGGGLMEVMSPAANHSISEPLRSQAAAAAAAAAAEITGSGKGGSGEEGQGHQPRSTTTCVMCLREQQLLEQMQRQQVLEQMQMQTHQAQRPRLPHRTNNPPGPHTHPRAVVNINDTFRPRGEEVPVAPPTSPLPLHSTPHLEPHSQALSPGHHHTSTSSPQPSSKLPPTGKQKEGQGRTPDPNADSATSQPVADPAEPGSDSEGSQDWEGSRRKLRVQVYLPKVASESADEDLRACVLEGRPAIARERHLSYTDLRKETGEEVEGGANGGEEQVGGGQGVKETEDPRRKATREEKKAKDPEERKRKTKGHLKKTGHHHSHTRSVRGGEEAGLGVGVTGVGVGSDWDSDSGRVSSPRRVALHTHPITVLKAEDCRQQE